MSLLEKNLKALKARSAVTCKWVELSKSPKNMEVAISRSGHPYPRLSGESLHSSAYPEKEGEQILRRYGIKPTDNCVVFGFGFGYHLKEIAKKAKRTVVVEPSPETIRAAFENIDLVDIIERVSIVSPENLDEAIDDIDFENGVWIDHEPTARCHKSARDNIAEPFIISAINARKKYRVMVVGPTYGGSAPTTQYCANALAGLGFHVDMVDNTPHSEELFKINQVTPNVAHQAFLKEIFISYLGEKIAAIMDDKQPDIVLALAQAPMSPTLITRLKNIGAPIIFWYVENHRTLPYWKNVAPCYDYFFGIQKGDFLEKLIDAGAPYAGYLPQAADPSVHKRVLLSENEKKEYGAKISFMGAGYPNRQKFLARLLDMPLDIWGTEWELSTPLGHRVKNKNRRLTPDEYVKIYNASKINLNLHSSLTSTGIDPLADFVNPRTFEVAACQAFGLTDERDDLAEMFKVGEELITFDSHEDLKEKIAYYLKNRDKREAVAKAGMKRVLSGHTFTHRMARMMSIVISREEGRIEDSRATRRGVNNVGVMMERTNKPEVKEFLQTFEKERNLSFAKVMEKIAEGSGELSRTESIFTMVDQIVFQEAK